jgi:hypothetical protein
LKRIRSLYPQLKLIVVEDGLAGNAPHIADLKELKMRYLLGAKPGDHAHLFDQVVAVAGESRTKPLTRLRTKATTLNTTMVMASKIFQRF